MEVGGAILVAALDVLLLLTDLLALAARLLAVGFATVTVGTVVLGTDLLVIRVFGAVEIVGRVGLAAAVGLDGADLVTVVLGAVALATVAGLDEADLATFVLGAAGLAVAILGAACLSLPAAYRGEMNTTIATNKTASLISILYFNTNIMNLRSVLPDLSWCKTGVINDRL